MVRLTRVIWLGAISTTIAMPGAAAAQGGGTLDLNQAVRDSHWRIVGRAVSIADVKGKRALRVSEGPGMGVLWLDGFRFEAGTIDLDVLGRSAPVQGSFVGVAFHVADSTHHEAVYFRPFNFRASDSAAHAHAVQYVSHPQWPWQVLRAAHPGQYERGIEPAPNGDEWFHVRVTVAGRTVSVFVNESAQPALVVQELGDLSNGSVGVWVGEGSGGYFANLRVTPAAR